MNTVREWLEITLGLAPQTQDRLASSLVIVLGMWLARRLVLRIVWNRTGDVRTRYRWQKTTSYILVPLGLLIVGRIWFEAFGPVATFLGLVSAGVAIALKDLLVNVAGWVFILWRRPFEVGDRIEIGDYAGDVIDIRLFQFSLIEIGNWVAADQSTGRIVHVPNGKVLTEFTANFTKGFQYIWNELPVLVTFESNWKRAKQIMAEIADRHGSHLTEAAERKIRDVSSRFMIFYQALTPIVYTSVADSGVLLTLRYLCEPRQRRSSEEAIWEEILEAFAACDDIDFAYPTRRFYDNRLEGKPGAGGPGPGHARGA
jgi:small-conductance mechanosensitive channel